MSFLASDHRYDIMTYRKCGNSGLKLPIISLGLWHNFGGVDSYENARSMVQKAFDLGITHFDLANNYGPPPGSSEETFGKILKDDFVDYRDELIISSKAGYRMWPGPYGDFGTRKYLVASLDQSLKRMGLDYLDIFYHHRPDPETPIEETAQALDHIVRSGRALYVGVSNYNDIQTQEISKILGDLKTPFIIHQPSYSMLNRWIEDKLLDVLPDVGVGCIVFSPLAQGLLSDKYLKGIPKTSRAANPHGFLQEKQVKKEIIVKIKKLNQIAKERGQSLAQLAIAWVLRKPAITSALIGSSRVEQIVDAVSALNLLDFDQEEIIAIDKILAEIKGDS